MPHRVRNFLRLLAAWRWDRVIRRRAVPGRWFIFRDAPDDVVTQWAESDVSEFADSLPLQQAIVQAQGERELRSFRRRHGSAAGSTAADSQPGVGLQAIPAGPVGAAPAGAASPMPAQRAS